jgi:hypothetical protein
LLDLRRCRTWKTPCRLLSPALYQRYT